MKVTGNVKETSKRKYNSIIRQIFESSYKSGIMRQVSRKVILKANEQKER